MSTIGYQIPRVAKLRKARGWGAESGTTEMRKKYRRCVSSYILKEPEGRRTPQSAWRNLMFDGLFQPSHLLIVLVVALFIFGPKKLPELGQGLGKGIRSFRDSMKAATEEPDRADNPSQKQTESTTK